MLSSRLVLLVCVVVCVYVSIPYASSSLICHDCMDGMPMSDCPNPAACGYKAVPCAHCMKDMNMTGCYNYTVCEQMGCLKCVDGVATSTCPNPGACGYKPLQCQDCMIKNNMSMPNCPDPAACSAAHCIDCMDGMPMPHCPYPAACGYKPFKCNDCVNATATIGCPYPQYCGYAPATNIPCINCMSMPMPTCPIPDLCPASAFASDCTMSMVFGTSQDVCILFQSWHVTNTGQYILAVILITITCIVREWMAIYRSYRIQVRTYRRKMGQSGSTSPAVTQGIDSLLYGASLTLAYILMLIFMTYNIGLCITVIIACIIANYVWAWYFKKQKKRMKQDIDTLTHDEHDAVNYHRTTNTATATTSNNPNSQPLLKATDGDHCCEDFEFDD